MRAGFEAVVEALEHKLPEGVHHGGANLQGKPGEPGDREEDGVEATALKGGHGTDQVAGPGMAIHLPLIEE